MGKIIWTTVLLGAAWYIQRPETRERFPALGKLLTRYGIPARARARA